MVQAVKEKGGLFLLQLWHVGRASHTGGQAMYHCIVPLRVSGAIAVAVYGCMQHPHGAGGSLPVILQVKAVHVVNVVMSHIICDVCCDVPRSLKARLLVFCLVC